MEDIFASLRVMEWDFEEFKKNLKQNYTFVTYGADNPMFGLKGENHPSHLWHKEKASKEYYEQKRKSVLESWMNNEDRKKQHSKKMKERWQSGKITPELDSKYPELELEVRCSKGTYIRSLAEDIGKQLGCYAHLIRLRRLSSGRFSLDNSIDLTTLKDSQIPITFLA
jgi:hypothetical protein